jgi:hypothetical protein
MVEHVCFQGDSDEAMRCPTPSPLASNLPQANWRSAPFSPARSRRPRAAPTNAACPLPPGHPSAWGC